MGVQNTLIFYDYTVRVRDPEVFGSPWTVFPIRAVSDKHADREARFGYTGLLGGEALEKVRDRLIVEVRRND